MKVEGAPAGAEEDMAGVDMVPSRTMAPPVGAVTEPSVGYPPVCNLLLLRFASSTTLTMFSPLLFLAYPEE